MILRPKRKEKGFRGGGGLRVVKEAQSRPFLCSPPIEFGGTGKCGNSHSKCRMFIRCSSSSGTD